LRAAVLGGASYVWVDCFRLIGRRRPSGAALADDLDIADHPLETARVGLVHGSAFGAPGHLRIGYARKEDELGAAMERIAAACAALQPSVAARGARAVTRSRRRFADPRRARS
jgi:aspartate aminotransferase